MKGSQVQASADACLCVITLFKDNFSDSRINGCKSKNCNRSVVPSLQAVFRLACKYVRIFTSALSSYVNCIIVFIDYKVLKKNNMRDF
jgi:hypothetical protein